MKRGVYSGREGKILGVPHIVVERGVYSGKEGVDSGSVACSRPKGVIFWNGGAYILGVSHILLRRGEGG